MISSTKKPVMTGEPSGTAGSPMLSILKQNNLCNVLVIVTRYFGGILLGTGGLVRCYSNSTVGSIEKAKIARIQKGTKFEVTINYANFQSLEHYAKINNIKISEVKYQELITCNLEINNIFKQKFMQDIENKKLELKDIKTIEENINVIENIL